MSYGRLFCAAIAALALTGCSVELHHDLSEQDANDIYVLLQENGINPTKVREEGGNVPTYMITVPKQDASTAARLLKEYSLPRPRVPGLNAFRENKGMIPTQTEERAMFLEAMGGEVSRSLNQIDGVLEARAIVMVPETSDLTQPENRPPNTASVLVKYRPMTDGKAPLNEDQIRKFVATSLPDMRPDNVTVILSQALPPQATGSPESQLKDVLGMRMTASSAQTFKIMMAIVVVLFLGLAGFSTMQLMKGSSGAATASARRVRPPRGDA